MMKYNITRVMDKDDSSPGCINFFRDQWNKILGKERYIFFCFKICHLAADPNHGMGAGMTGVKKKKPILKCFSSVRTMFAFATVHTFSLKIFIFSLVFALKEWRKFEKRLTFLVFFKYIFLHKTLLCFINIHCS